MMNDWSVNVQEEDYRKLLSDRIDGILSVAAHLGYRVLVLGAFGCGAFGNDAAIVSDTFRDRLKDYGEFSIVSFAVLDHSTLQYNYQEFNRIFSGKPSGLIEYP